MGSSTADIGATLYALGWAVGRQLAASEVARLALQVEPSDSSLFPGLALWDHRHGQRYEDLGAVPPLIVLVLDPGGEVDTLAFNRLDHRQMLRQLASQHQEAFVLLRQGLQQGNPEAIGAAATLSATAHGRYCSTRCSPYWRWLAMSRPWGCVAPTAGRCLGCCSIRAVLILTRLWRWSPGVLRRHLRSVNCRW